MNRSSESGPPGHRLVLFVCSGNTCRSPMAEAILRRHAAEGLLAPHVRVTSAGVSAIAGATVSPTAALVARGNGLDLSAKRSAPLTAGLVRQSDLIIVMEPQHRTGVLNLAPTADEKTVLITDLSDNREPRGVPDPYGGTIEDYRRCFDTLDRLIRESLSRIESRLAGPVPRGGPPKA